MVAKIYKPAKTAMQSGRQKTYQWIVEFIQSKPTTREPVMGWPSCEDTGKQVKLKFETQEKAIQYCEKNSLEFHVINNNERKIKPKSYASNFSYDRKESWTH